MPTTTKQSYLLQALSKFRSILGSAGVNGNEGQKVRKVARYFSWLMLLIVFWLPFQWHFSLTGAISSKLNYLFNWFIWATFVAETTVLTSLVKNKRLYLLTNWLNLFIIIAGFPLLWDYIHYFAAFSVLRILVTINIITPWISHTRTFFTKNHLGTGILIFVLGTFIGGILISSVDPAIHDPLEGVWWAWETITTVGYGDFIPVTWGGRIISIFVMLMGIGLFSLITANFSAFLMGKETEKEKRLTRENAKLLKYLIEKIDSLEKDIKKLRS